MDFPSDQLGSLRRPSKINDVAFPDDGKEYFC